MKSTPDISTTYLGIPLRSPLIPAASPQTEHIDGLSEMERCGAGAVVLHSLFENPYQERFQHVEAYLDEISAAKRQLKIPVIASLNANTPEGWVRLAKRIEKAGADAIELNIYRISLTPDMPSSKIEEGYVEIVRHVASVLEIPVSVKLPPYFTNLALLSSQLEDAGAKGLIFFNRLYQPDLDLLSMGPGNSMRLSTGAENRLPMLWLSLIYRQVRLDLAAGTGVRTGSDVLKMILSGACATQLCSVLLQRGIPWLELVTQDLLHWMDICHVTSLKEAKGILARQPNEEAEDEEYRRALQGYSGLEVPEPSERVPRAGALLRSRGGMVGHGQ